LIEDSVGTDSLSRASLLYVFYFFMIYNCSLLCALRSGSDRLAISD
jgi:hypothetical protein